MLKGRIERQTKLQVFIRVPPPPAVAKKTIAADEKPFEKKTIQKKTIIKNKTKLTN